MNPATPTTKSRQQQASEKFCPDGPAARSLLAFLAGYQNDSASLAKEDIDEKQLAGWLVAHGLGPLAYARLKTVSPSLAAFLEPDFYSTVAQNSLHQHNLAKIADAFAQERVDFALLKGAAVAESTPGGWETRTMGDVDIWLQDDDFDWARNLMDELGFDTGEKETRPQALQMMSNGEVQYFKPEWQRDLVELHLSPYPGWWLQRTTQINKQSIWNRMEPLDRWPFSFQLAPEDMVIQIAVHMAINHQCSLMPLRSLLDIAHTVNRRPVDWQAVSARAQQMRVSTALWLVLTLLQQLVGTPGLEQPLRKLEPSGWRQKTLQELVTAESLLLGKDLSSGRMRFVYLLLLVDRKRDMGRLVFRTMWPEKEWLQARYKKPVGHLQHMTHMMRHGQV